jgi:hypothetical protein
MARALLGHIGSQNEQVLAFEIGRLRRRVTELEAEVASLRAPDSDSTAELDLELHRMAEVSEPVLA